MSDGRYAHTIDRRIRPMVTLMHCRAHWRSYHWLCRGLDDYVHDHDHKKETLSRAVGMLMRADVSDVMQPDVQRHIFDISKNSSNDEVHVKRARLDRAVTCQTRADGLLWQDRNLLAPIVQKLLSPCSATAHSVDEEDAADVIVATLASSSAGALVAAVESSRQYDERRHRAMFRKICGRCREMFTADATGGYGVDRG